MSMIDNDIFTTIACQKGFTAPMAQTVLETTARRLRQRGHHISARYYTYRSTKGGSGDERDRASERPRLVLAFATADTALSFAQRSRVGQTPRLLRVSLAQLLAVLIQRPLIEAVLFVDEPITIAEQNQLPIGLRLERNLLLTMLKGEMFNG